jgi:hypothetical protein
VAQAAQLENAPSATPAVETTTNTAAFARYKNSTAVRRKWEPVSPTDRTAEPYIHAFHHFSSLGAGALPGMEFWDPGNADSYIEVGVMLVAQVFQPAVNANLGWSIAYEEDSDTLQALGGQRYRSVSGRSRVLTMTHEWLTQAEAITESLKIDRLVGSSGGVFVSIDTDKTDANSEWLDTPDKWSIWGYQESVSPIVHKRYSVGSGGSVYKKTWNIREVLP